MPATASDPELPSELVYDILDLLISDLVYSCRPPHPSPVEVARVEENHRKRTLAACSLISFHWAQKFRPLLFCHLVLQSSEDVDTLNSFLRWKGSDRVPPISRYVERLSVAVCVQGTGTPWIHRVYPLLKKLGPGAELQSWHFNRYRPDNSTDIVTWAHRDIPRTLPGCYHAFTEVTLSDVHFPQYSTLMTLLASLPRLRHLRLERITWDAASDLSAGISLSVAGFTLHVNHCTDVALMAVQGLSRGHPNRRSQPSSLSLGSAEWRAVVNTIKFWTQNCWKGTRALYVEVQPLKKDCEALRIAVGMEWSAPGIVSFVPIGAPALIFHARVQAATSVVVDTLVVDCEVNSVDADVVEKCDWRRLEKRIGAMTNLTTVVFVFATGLAARDFASAQKSRIVKMRQRVAVHCIYRLIHASDRQYREFDVELHCRTARCAHRPFYPLLFYDIEADEDELGEEELEAMVENEEEFDAMIENSDDSEEDLAVMLTSPGFRRPRRSRNIQYKLPRHPIEADENELGEEEFDALVESSDEEEFDAMIENSGDWEEDLAVMLTSPGFREPRRSRNMQYKLPRHSIDTFQDLE